MPKIVLLIKYLSKFDESIIRRCVAHMVAMPKVKVAIRTKSCLSNNSKTTEANLTKLHRKIEHNEKLCRA